jgi:hypothetical protein
MAEQHGSAGGYATTKPATVRSAGSTPPQTNGYDSKQPRKPRAKRSGFHRQPGARSMKEYPLTGPEMWSLAGIGLAATIFFGAGSFFLSTWFDLAKDLAVPPDEMTTEMKGYFRGLATASGWACVISFALGVVLTAVNGLTILHILRGTEHPE